MSHDSAARFMGLGTAMFFGFILVLLAFAL